MRANSQKHMGTLDFSRGHEAENIPEKTDAEESAQLNETETKLDEKSSTKSMKDELKAQAENLDTQRTLYRKLIRYHVETSQEIVAQHQKLINDIVSSTENEPVKTSSLEDTIAGYKTQQAAFVSECRKSLTELDAPLADLEEKLSALKKEGPLPDEVLRSYHSIASEIEQQDHLMVEHTNTLEKSVAKLKAEYNQAHQNALSRLNAQKEEIKKTTTESNNQLQQQLKLYTQQKETFTQTNQSIRIRLDAIKDVVVSHMQKELSDEESLQLVRLEHMIDELIASAQTDLDGDSSTGESMSARFFEEIQDFFDEAHGNITERISQLKEGFSATDKKLDKQLTLRMSPDFSSTLDDIETRTGNLGELIEQLTTKENPHLPQLRAETSADGTLDVLETAEEESHRPSCHTTAEEGPPTPVYLSKRRGSFWTDDTENTDEIKSPRSSLASTRTPENLAESPRSEGTNTDPGTPKRKSLFKVASLEEEMEEALLKDKGEEEPESEEEDAKEQEPYSTLGNNPKQSSPDFSIREHPPAQQDTDSIIAPILNEQLKIHQDLATHYQRRIDLKLGLVVGIVAVASVVAVSAALFSAGPIVLAAIATIGIAANLLATRWRYQHINQMVDRAQKSNDDDITPFKGWLWSHQAEQHLFIVKKMQQFQRTSQPADLDTVVGNCKKMCFFRSFQNTVEALEVKNTVVLKN